MEKGLEVELLLRHVVVSVDEYMCAFSSRAHSGHEPKGTSHDPKANFLSKRWLMVKY